MGARKRQRGLTTAPVDEDGFTLVEGKRPCRQVDGQPALKKPPTETTTQQHRRNPEAVRRQEWRITAHEEASVYSAVTALERAHPGFKLAVRLTRGEQHFLSGRDEASALLLRQIADGSIASTTVLEPAARESRGVLSRYPCHYPLEPVTAHPDVLSAERCVVKVGHGRMEPTRQVELRFRGPLLPSLDLGAWGAYTVRPYNREPLRCYRCHAFGHHQRHCTFVKDLCGVCSGGHPTTQCLTVLKEGGPRPVARCPNCSKGHHAWNRRCPERLRRMQSTPQPTPPAERRRKRRRRRRKRKRAETEPADAAAGPGEGPAPSPPRKKTPAATQTEPDPPASPPPEETPVAEAAAVDVAEPSLPPPPHRHRRSPPVERSIPLHEVHDLLLDFRQLLQQEVEHLARQRPTASAVSVAMQYLAEGKRLPELLNGIEDDGFFLDGLQDDDASWGSLSDEEDLILE